VEQGWQDVDQTFRCAAFQLCRPVVSRYIAGSFVQMVEIIGGIIGCAAQVSIVAKDVKKEW
jgi:hypothetical protein